MCVAAASAHFSETILYHGRCHHPSHGLVHVLGYQNVAANHAAGPNAMLLHLPGIGMSQDNFVDTSGSRGILTDMTAELGPPISVGSRAPGGAAPPAVQVFEHDIYTVVLAANATLIPEALRLVPEHRRIPANRDLFDCPSTTGRSPAGPFLPTVITGRAYTGVHPNGDFMIPYADLAEGRMTAMERVGPGGARLTMPEPPEIRPNAPQRGPRPYGR